MARRMFKKKCQHLSDLYSYCTQVRKHIQHGCVITSHHNKLQIYFDDYSLRSEMVSRKVTIILIIL